MTETPQPLLLSLDEFASLVSVSPRTVRRLIDDGEIAVTRVGARLRIPYTEIQRYLDSAKPEPKESE